MYSSSFDESQNEKKSPWGSPEVLRLEMQLSIVAALRQLVAAKMNEKGATIEVEEGPRFTPIITFRCMDKETDWDAVVKDIEALSSDAAKLMESHKLGTLVLAKDEARKAVRVEIKG